jgi:hypothetical protein
MKINFAYLGFEQVAANNKSEERHGTRRLLLFTIFWYSNLHFSKSITMEN